MLVLFSHLFCRELKRLAKKAPDLPGEIVRAISSCGVEPLPGEVTIRASSSRRAHLLKCRFGSRERRTGKKGGYRAYYARMPEQLLFLEVVSKRETEDIPAAKLKRMKELCVQESFETLDEEWFTLEDFCREFGIPGS